MLRGPPALQFAYCGAKHAISGVVNDYVTWIVRG